MMDVTLLRDMFHFASGRHPGARNANEVFEDECLESSSLAARTSLNQFKMKRKKWCPGWESNPHEEKSPEDFKSSASAIPPPGPGRYKKVAFMEAALNVARMADMPRTSLGRVFSGISRKCSVT